MISCSCHRTYTVAAFRELPLVGTMSDAPHGSLEMHLCVCRSTRALRVVSVPKRARGTVRRAA